MNIVEQNWDLILNKMKLEYCSSNISYTTWIAPLTVYEVKDNTVYILVQLRASLEHIEEKYLLPFKVCIAEVTGIEFEVAFVTDNEAVIQEKKENIIKKNRVNAIYEKANLNPKYTFDTGIPMTIQWYLDNKEWWENIISGEYQNYFEKMYVEKGRAKE